MGYVMPWAHVFRPTSQRKRISIESSIPLQLELVVIIIVLVVVAGQIRQILAVKKTHRRK